MKEVTDASFEEDVLRADGTVLLEFWAQWCPPCRVLSPILEQLAEEHPVGFTVLKINADDNPHSAIAYQAMSLPTMKVFRGGEVVKTMIGARPKAALERDLAEFLV